MASKTFSPQSRFEIGCPVALSAPAKINLILRVGPRRDDGYHELASWMHTVALSDRLLLTPLASTGISLDVSLLPELPASQSFSVESLKLADIEENLVVRALRAYTSQNPFPPLVDGSAIQGWKILLNKAIPFQAGLGGGSSDAAAILRALNERHPNPLSFEAMVAMARQLGADIPFGLSEGSVWAEGVGERMQPLPLLPGWPVWLIKPRQTAIATPEAFRLLSQQRASSGLATGITWPVNCPIPAQVPVEMVPSLEVLNTFFQNDFDVPMMASSPALDELFTRLKSVLSPYPVRPTLSGSGPTVFVVFPDFPPETLREVLLATFPIDDYWHAWTHL